MRTREQIIEQQDKTFDRACNPQREVDKLTGQECMRCGVRLVLFLAGPAPCLCNDCRDELQARDGFKWFSKRVRDAMHITRQMYDT